jgi:hypothetical protein
MAVLEHGPVDGQSATSDRHPRSAYEELPLMPRSVLPVLTLGLILLLGGCAGFGDFLTDTHTFTANKNRPVGDSENIRRVSALPVDIDPLTPETGNIWPTQQVADPTLLNVMEQNPETQKSMQGIQQNEQQRLQYQYGAPPGAAGSPTAPQPERAPHPGSSAPPSSVAPALQPLPSNQYQAPPVSSTAPSRPSTTVETPNGAGVTTGGGPGYSTITSPKAGGGTAIVVPNGNGTSTVINPDGTIQTIPTPK